MSVFTHSVWQEGTIGGDLVVKPVPASVRQHLDHRTDDDDEAFLDEEVEEDVVSRGGFPLPPKHHHIVYRRNIADPADGELSDYGKYFPI